MKIKVPLSAYTKVDSTGLPITDETTEDRIEPDKQETTKEKRVVPVNNIIKVPVEQQEPSDQLSQKMAKPKPANYIDTVIEE